MAKRLHVEPYDPNSRDADGDGIVQEGTIWERPASTHILDHLGHEITAGATSGNVARIVDRKGKEVKAPAKKPSAKPGPESPLGGLGPKLGPSLQDMGVPSVSQIVSPITPKQNESKKPTVPDVPSVPDAPQVPLEEPKKPRPPSPPPFSGKAAELADAAGGDWTKFKELLDKEGYVVFDYETTGFSDGDIPVQVGAVKFKDGEEVGRINIFMNPERPLGTWALGKLKDENGDPLTDEYLAQQISVAEGHRQLTEFLDGGIVVAHNLPYDQGVLERTLKEHGMEDAIPKGGIDTLELARQVLPKGEGGPTSHGLGPLAEFLGIDAGAWHTADADAAATAQVLTAELQRSISQRVDGQLLNSKHQKNLAEAAKAKYVTDMEAYRVALDEHSRAVSQGADLAPLEPVKPPNPPAVEALFGFVAEGKGEPTRYDWPTPKDSLTMTRETFVEAAIKDITETFSVSPETPFEDYPKPVKDLLASSLRKFDAAKAKNESDLRAEELYRSGVLVTGYGDVEVEDTLSNVLDVFDDPDFDDAWETAADIPEWKELIDLRERYNDERNAIWDRYRNTPDTMDLALQREREFREAKDRLQQEFVTIVDRRMGALINSPTTRQFIQVDLETFPAILNDGRFKDMTEDGALGSATGDGSGTRLTMEQRWFGIMPKSPGRPIYGYLWDSPSGAVLHEDEAEPGGGINLGHPKAAMTYYGEMAVRLSPNTKSRSTVTLGDSFAEQGAGAPVPMVLPSIKAAGVYSMWVATTEGVSDTSYLGVWGVEDKSLPRVAPPYVETQFHGGIGLKDIEAVIIPKWAQTSEGWEPLIDLIREKGLKIEWV